MLRSILSVSLVLSGVVAPALAAFGVTVSGNSLIVDTAGGLVFTGTPVFNMHTHEPKSLFCIVEQTSGDITSMLYNGIQAQDQTKRSHIVS
jgi:rhamnogalacturonan endolyase